MSPEGEPSMQDYAATREAQLKEQRIALEKARTADRRSPAEQWIAARHRGDYATRQNIMVRELDVFDEEPASLQALIDRLSAFRDAHASHQIKVDYEDWDSRRLRFRAFRYETDEELNARIAGYHAEYAALVASLEAREREVYAALKAKFETEKPM